MKKKHAISMPIPEGIPSELRNIKHALEYKDLLSEVFVHFFELEVFYSLNNQAEYGMMYLDLQRILNSMIYAIQDGTSVPIPDGIAICFKETRHALEYKEQLSTVFTYFFSSEDFEVDGSDRYTVMYLELQGIIDQMICAVQDHYKPMPI